MSDSPSSEFRVTAIISAFNEADIIGQALSHLVDQGIDIYCIDHSSSDGTLEIARSFLGRGVRGVEIFPEESGFPAEERDNFRWASILKRKEQLAATLDSDWFMHHDADEFRESPWPHLSLREAIRQVDALDYNAVDFHVATFVPDRDGFSKSDDPRIFFRYCSTTSHHDRIQIKCWKKTASVDLVTTGGHEAVFPERKVFPIRFLMRHYPVRSQEQGNRKIFTERIPRFVTDEKEQGWHVQYNGLREGMLFIDASPRLDLFDEDRLRIELLVRHRIVENLENEKNALAARNADLGDESDRMRRECETEREILAEQIRVLEKCRADLETRVAETERAREELQGELEQQAQDQKRAGLEFTRRESEHARLKSDHSRLESDHAWLSSEINRICNSKSWRWTAPLRAIRSRFNRDLNRRKNAPDSALPDARERDSVEKTERKRILVVDEKIPTPDRDSGSQDTFNVLRILRALNFEVTFVNRDPVTISRYADDLRHLGVKLPHNPHTTDFESALAEHIPKQNVVLLIRALVAHRAFAVLKKINRNIPAIFDTVDLHFLRHEREALTLGDKASAKLAAEVRKMELEVMRNVDATIVRSHFEMQLVKKILPSARLLRIPIVRDIPDRTPPPFDGRKDVLFVGGFDHRPNVDAILFFVKEVWPMIRAASLKTGLFIAGTNAPAEVQMLAAKDISILGHVPDLTSLYDSCLLSVAPLRYGAGLKGKVIASMTNGLPVVGTPMAIEGSGLIAGEHLLVGETPKDIADAILRLHGEAELWGTLSAEALNFCRVNFSMKVGFELMAGLLEELGVITIPGRSQNKSHGFSTIPFNLNA